MTAVSPQDRFAENCEQIKSRFGNEGIIVSLQTAYILLFTTVFVGRCKMQKRMLYAIK